MKMKPSPFLKMMGLGEPPRPVYPNLTPRQQWLLYGWGRYLARHLVAYKEEQERLIRLRPRRNWAILVEDDSPALWYQILHFRIARARYAFGSFGMLSKAVYGDDGFVYQDVREDNRENLDRHYRQPAHKARKLLQERGQFEHQEEPNDGHP